MQPVLDLPKYVVAGSLEDLRTPGARPAESKYGYDDAPNDPDDPVDPSEASSADPSAMPSASAASTKTSDVPSAEPSGEVPDPRGFDGGSRAQPGMGSGKPAPTAKEPVP